MEEMIVMLALLSTMTLLAMLMHTAGHGAIMLLPQTVLSRRITREKMTFSWLSWIAPEKGCGQPILVETKLSLLPIFPYQVMEPSILQEAPVLQVWLQLEHISSLWET